MVRGAMWMENILPGHRSANSPPAPAVVDESGGGSVSPRSLPPVYQAPPPPPPSYPHGSGGATKRYSTGGTGAGGGSGVDRVVTSAAASGYNPWLVRVRATTVSRYVDPFSLSTELPDPPTLPGLSMLLGEYYDSSKISLGCIHHHCIGSSDLPVLRCAHSR